MKTIYQNTHNDRWCTIDDKTELWLARMIIGEGGKNCSFEKASAMLWALMNRWHLHPGRRHWPTFLYMVRRFSQPVNPRWQKDGDLTRKAIKKHGPKYWAVTPARLRRRAKICSMEWGDIPMDVADEVARFKDGRQSPPYKLTTVDHQRISNWASYDGLQRKYPWGIDFDGDWFFEDARLVATGHVVINHWGE